MKWASILHNIFSKCTKFSTSWCKRLKIIISKTYISVYHCFISHKMWAHSSKTAYSKISHINRKHWNRLLGHKVRAALARLNFSWSRHLWRHSWEAGVRRVGLARRKVKTWWRRTSEGKRRSVLSHERRVNEPHRGLMYGPAWGRSLAERRRCKLH